MAKLSITAAWDETSDILRRDFGALFTVALALNALPQVIFQALGPGRVAPGAAPPQPGLWLLLLPFAILLGFVGSIAITALALGLERVVGSAIVRGFRRFLPLLAASLVLGLLLAILFAILLLVLGVRPTTMASNPTGTVAGLGLAMLIMIPLLLFVAVRLMMMTPVATGERGGPIALVARSWALTAGHFWKLLGFLLLMGIIFIVVTIVVGAVAGVVVAMVAGLPTPGSVSQLLILIVGGVVNAAMVAVLTTLVARIYVQLAADPASTARVFE